MIRSGIETTLRAVLYSGCFSKRVLCSSVETSSVVCLVSLVWGRRSIRRGRGHTFIGLLELGLGGKVGHGCFVRVSRVEEMVCVRSIGEREGQRLDANVEGRSWSLGSGSFLSA